MEVRIIRASVVVAAVLAASLLGPSALAISVKPAFLDLEVNPGEHHTGMFTVVNTSDGEERFRASPSHFRLSREGNLQPAPSDSFSVAEWIKFNPKEFTLTPRARQQIRYTLIVPPDAKPGDRWCVLEFMKLTARTLQAGDTSDGGTSVKLAVSSAIVVPIFVQVGEVGHEWSLVDLEAQTDEKGSRVSITLGNTSNGRVPFETEVDIVDANGEVVAHEERGRLSLFPFSERVLQMPIETELQPGEYMARVRVSSEETGDLVAGETALRVPMKP